MSAAEYLQETKAIKTICRHQVEVSDPWATSFCYYLCTLKRHCCLSIHINLFNVQQIEVIKLKEEKAQKTTHKITSPRKTRFHVTVRALILLTLFLH